MRPATLTAEHIDGERMLILDCRHGATMVAVINGTRPEAPQISELAAVQAALLKHYSVEKCRCTLPLRRRFGVRA